jgi:hypothetical protein
LLLLLIVLNSANATTGRTYLKFTRPASSKDASISNAPNANTNRCN